RPGKAQGQQEVRPAIGPPCEGRCLLLTPEYEIPRAACRRPSVDALQGKDLAAGRQQQLLHVLAAHLEASSSDAGDHLEFRRIICSPANHAELAEMLDAGYLVPRRAVVLGDFRFDDHLRVELTRDHEIRYDEIRGLIKTWKPLRALGLAEADPGASE